ncbi:MAG: ABC transporter ATP-binding protein [Coriobacteriia bacterium]|nr:ABC transporter ATP-binding protein [Coriobacteriia bacterium]
MTEKRIIEPAVRLSHLTKSYKIYDSSLERALDLFRSTSNTKRFVALKDISADFPQGEAIAILGTNGSGKSTMLKIITGVAAATKGTVEVNGRVAAMLELKTGFDNELTGIENIDQRALTLGISPERTTEMKDKIIAFADIGEHINQPVRTYSSGMKARLGFAISVNIDPDILIIDEVLSVGDNVFRLKCIEKMDEFRKANKTILFVSHSLATVKSFCTKAMWIKEGVLQNYGEVGPIVQEYEDYLRLERARQRAAAREEVEAEGLRVKSDIFITGKFKMGGVIQNDIPTFEMGESIVFRFTYTIKEPIETLRFCFSLTNAEEIEIFGSDKQDASNIVDSSVGTHTIRVRVKHPRLLAGEYQISGSLWSANSMLHQDYANRVPFVVKQDEFIGSGIVKMDYALSVDKVKIR